MRRHLSTVLVAVSASGVAAVLAVVAGRGPLEWAFLTLLLTCLGYVVTLGVRAGRRTRAERIRAATLAATRPDDVARSAIREERRRLIEEITAVLRDTLGRILTEARTVPTSVDPTPMLRSIHRRTRLATSELRRQLGLLRTEVADDDVPAVGAPAPVGWPRSDLVLGIALALLGAVEAIAYHRSEDAPGWSEWSVPVTALAAGTAAGRRVGPGPAAAMCAVLFAVGSVLGAPVISGAWMLGTLGSLAWAIAARAPAASWAPVGGVALGCSVVGALARDDPENLPIAVALLVVSSAGGLVVRWARQREGVASLAARARERELEAAARDATRSERAVLARELHDVVSHAVGLIAVQAAAAQVSWPDRPDVVHRAAEVIVITAESALADLGRLAPVRDGAAIGLAGSLPALRDRIRACGTPVELVLVSMPPPELAAVVYRVVQESLTNAVRHAAGAPVVVQVTDEGLMLRVRVSDAGSGPAPTDVRGYGLIGLAERVALAGGTLTAGSGASGGFEVVAELPVRPAVVSS
jgi:signal transduction histidine kinase